jgi:hypothetical protein
MLSQLEFSQYNFRILNFNYLFKDIEINIINDLHTHHLLKDRVDTNARRFFYHHIIHGLCEILIKNKVKEKTIIYFNSTQLGNFQLLKYYKEEDILELLNVIFKKIKKLLPIKIFISSISFDFLSYLLQKNDGRSTELISNIRSYLDSVSLENYTFSDIRKFTLKYGLLFLNKEYFNQLKAKQLIIV